MGDVVPFKRPKASERHRGKTLCRNNLHRWTVWKEKQFDVREGRLVTVYRCSRCGVTKVKTF